MATAFLLLAAFLFVASDISRKLITAYMFARLIHAAYVVFSGEFDCFKDVVTKSEAQTLIEIIEVWKSVAKKHSVRWVVVHGTELGLRRHGGRIPWDDDVDFFVHPADGEKVARMRADLLARNVVLMKPDWMWGDGFKIFHKTKKNNFSLFPSLLRDMNAGSFPFVDIFLSTSKFEENETPELLLNPESQIEEVEFLMHKDLKPVKVFATIRLSEQTRTRLDVLFDSRSRHKYNFALPGQCQFVSIPKNEF